MEASDCFAQLTPPLDRRLATGLGKLAQAIRHHERSQALASGLSATQAQILALVSQEGAKTPSSLSQVLGVALPTISDSVGALVAKNLVQRKPAPGRGRTTLLTLTRTGQIVARQALRWPDFLAPAIGTLPDAQQVNLLSTLMLLIRALQESGRIPVQRMCLTCTFFRPNVHEGARPHHCAFVDAPMAATHLRLACEEHEVASEQAQATQWEQFLRQAV